ncbi:hypothetical protein CDAR_296161 [Caerostris darwini]|uniref:Uncharacterized protein n=1 Tax=Caerostris darwini TaxID=1538125 RepID=A0AAV4URW7_9ARAC|nr:hypothetical protein CDAR_296161 [Caerostris darwini]
MSVYSFLCPPESICEHVFTHPYMGVDFVDILDWLKNVEFLSYKVLYLDYRQSEKDEADREKITYITTEDLYEFKIMPFGLCIPLAIFDRKWTLSGLARRHNNILENIQRPLYSIKKY